MGPGRRPTQNLRFSESRSVMKSKFRPILAPALLALLAAGCAGNVRWRHPAPDEALLRQMLSDINGFHVTGHGGREDDTLLSPERARAILARHQREEKRWKTTLQPRFPASRSATGSLSTRVPR